MDKLLMYYMHATPRLMSLLYDMDLMPEQTVDNKREYLRTIMLIEAWKNNEEVK